MEYIFVDDCSPDNSITIMQKVLEEYPQRKDQVKIIRHEFNQGVGAARNHDVAACTGNYIIHCDPDDWVDLNMYEAMYNKAIENDADVTCCSFVCEYDNNKKRIIQLQEINSTEYIKQNFEAHLGALVTKLYRRELAISNDIYAPDHICMGEDLLRNAQTLAQCNTIACATDVYYHYW